MEFIKVNNVLMSTLGGEFMLRVHHDVGVVAFVGKEWGYSSGSTRSIVVGKLSERKELWPVVLLVVAEYLEELF